MRVSFLEIAPVRYERALIIVDVDGTLVPDRGSTLPADVRSTLRALAEVADVRLCSNALPDRTAAFAKDAGVGHLRSSKKKPSRRVIEGIESLPKRVVVIGDKALTDGLFAANIGAEFVKVARIRGSGESVAGRVGYALDLMIAPALDILAPALPHLMLMRPTQWMKNLLIFTPLFFAGAAFSLPLLLAAVAAFAAFSLAASAMYALNDYRDRDADRMHPTKRFRPIARGAVGGRGALLLISALGAMSALIVLAVPGLLMPLVAYVALNTAYSFFLKRIPVADVVSVSGSYVLRVLAGGSATGIFVSPWLISCVFFGALILITGKRRAEFSRTHRRSVLKRYSREALDSMLLAAALLAVLSYVLYAFFAGHGPVVAGSAVVVALAIVRLVWLVFTSEDAEYPEVLALKDPVILGLSFLWIALMFSVLYL